MMQYLVTFTRTGGVVIEADSKDKAASIANSMTLDDVSWDDDWPITDVQEMED